VQVRLAFGELFTGGASNMGRMSWFWDEMWTWKLGTHF
jgi:hypothetical protein